MKKRRFIHNALMMTTSSLILRFIAMWFWVYISNKIGAEGVGLYQLSLSIFSLAITFSFSGISVAVTRITSEEIAKKNYLNANKAFKRCVCIGLGLSFTAMIVLYLTSNFIGTVFLTEPRVIKPLQYLAIGLPFLTISSLLRGYFIGVGETVEAIIGDIVEQIFLIIATIIALVLYIDTGIEGLCCAVVISSTISEILACCFSFGLYFCKKKSLINFSGNSFKCMGKIFEISYPIAISNYIRSGLTSLENILIPSGLKKFGGNGSLALAQYGMIKGMVMSVIFFPTAVLNAFSSMLVPEVSSAVALGNNRRIEFIIHKCFKATLLFAFFSCGIIMTFAQDLAFLLYKNQDYEVIGKMILTLAPLIPMIYLDQVVDSILKGLNEQVAAMKYNTFDSIMRVLIIYTLVPTLGLNGYIIMLYAGTIFNTLMSINRLISVSQVKFNLLSWVILPIISIALPCSLIFPLHQLALTPKLLIISVLYYASLRISKCITKTDLIWLSNIFRR